MSNQAQTIRDIGMVAVFYREHLGQIGGRGFENTHKKSLKCYQWNVKDFSYVYFDWFLQ